MDWMVMDVIGNPNHWDVEVTLKSIETGEIKTKFFDRQNWEYGEGSVLDLTEDAEVPGYIYPEEEILEAIEQNRQIYEMEVALGWR